MKPPKLVTADCGAVCPPALARKLDGLTKSLPQDQSFRRKLAAPTSVQTDPATRTDVSVVSADAVDRDFEIVDPAGVDLADYRANPVVLFGHDPLKPVGKALWVKAHGSQIVAKTHYPERPSKHQGDWLPDTVWSLIAADVLRGKSIGFLPLELRDPTAEEKEKGARLVISKSLLCEYSVVSVPSNPAALVEQINKGLQLESVLTWKVTGRAKQPTPKAPDWSRFKLDPNEIASTVLDRLAARWGV